MGLFNEEQFCLLSLFLPYQEVYHLLNDKPPLLLLTVLEFTFSSQEQIAYFLTQEAVHLLVHFKFFSEYSLGLFLSEVMGTISQSKLKALSGHGTTKNGGHFPSKAAYDPFQ